MVITTAQTAQLFLLIVVAVLSCNVEGRYVNRVLPPGVWGNWTACSKSCGGGSQQREKMCGTFLCGRMVALCHSNLCDGPYTKSLWGGCSKTCGGGRRSRLNKAGKRPQNIGCNTHSCEGVSGDCTADVVFVIDSSGSINDKNWYAAKQFVIDVAKGIRLSQPDTRFGVVTYSTVAEGGFDLGKYSEIADVQKNIWALPHLAGPTNTADGLRKMRAMFQQDGFTGRKAVAVVVTDGRSIVDRELTPVEAASAREDGIGIFAIGVGDAYEEELNSIASDPSSYFVHTSGTYSTVKRITKSIVQRICHM